MIEGPSSEVSTNAFRARLANGELILEMCVHFASEAEARSIADPFVKGWEIQSGLRRGRAEISFEFLRANIIDRSPPTDGSNCRSFMLQLPPPQIEFSVVQQPIKKGYPKAVPGFRATRDVEILWGRHQAYVEGREPLTSVAYFCLTFVEGTNGGEANAAKKYKIARGLFKRIGALVGDRGDYLTTRKFVVGKTPQPLTQEELRWLEAAIRILIWRVGQPPSEDDALITVDKVIGCDFIKPEVD